MYPVPHSCSVCGHSSLVVNKIDCSHCQTSMTGQFVLHRFNRLTPEQLQFIEIFVTCEGKINRVEEAMGISYQAVRGRLHETITALGGTIDVEENSVAVPTPPPPPAPPSPPPAPTPAPAKPKANQAAKKREILAKVSAGELSAAEAADLLKKL